MKQFAIAFLVLLLGGCATRSIITDYSDDADFTQYRSWSFALTEDAFEGDNRRVRHATVQAVRQGMVSSGLWETESTPDLRVTFWASVNREVRVHNMSGTVAHYSAPRHWHHGMHFGSGRTTTTHQRGTILVDIWDPRRGELVWRGQMSDDLAFNDDRSIEIINEAVADLFRSFPPTD